MWTEDGLEIKETTGDDLQEVRAELCAKSKRKITIDHWFIFLCFLFLDVDICFEALNLRFKLVSTGTYVVIT